MKLNRIPALLLSILLLFSLSACTDKEAVRQEGYDAGYEEGYQAGLTNPELSYNTGLQAGRAAAEEQLSAAYDEAYTAAYDEGYEKAQQYIASETAVSDEVYNNDSDDAIFDLSPTDGSYYLLQSLLKHDSLGYEGTYKMNADGSYTYNVDFWFLDNPYTLDSHMDADKWLDFCADLKDLFITIDGAFNGDVRYNLVMSAENRTKLLSINNGVVTYDRYAD